MWKPFAVVGAGVGLGAIAGSSMGIVAFGGALSCMLPVTARVEEVPMNDLFYAEEYKKFSVAAFEARRIAREYGEPVDVERSVKGWVVLVTFDVLRSIALEMLRVEEIEQLMVEEMEKQKIEDSSDLEDESYWAEDDDEKAERIEEFLDYEDSFARSEEEGWYYED